MSTGAIFQLITNDGKQDRMLMASALLRRRLRRIRMARRANPGIKDETPTLLDIEKTHVLLVNAHFKPFAAIGYEYYKVRTTGQAVLGGPVQFSIPQYGDFFHDMAVHVILNPPTVERFYPDDAQSAQNSLTEGVQNNPCISWAAYPGERLLQKVKFNVNGNPLDEYTSNSYNFFREFAIRDSKKAGWDRCVGQETAKHGWYHQAGITFNVDQLASGAANTASTGIPWSGSDCHLDETAHRLGGVVYTGPQTPKYQLNELEMLIPLLFWFNLDPRLSVPSVSIPYGQRFIDIDLATQAQMYGLIPRGSGTWASPNGTITPPSQDIQTIELYINNIFVNPEVHEIYIRRIGFTMIRVHREQTQNVSNATDSILLSQLKWPIEMMFVGMRVRNQTEARNDNLHRWYDFSLTNYGTYDLAQSVSTDGGNTSLTVFDSGAGDTFVAVDPGDGTDVGQYTSATANVFDNLSIGDQVVIGGVPSTVLEVQPDPANIINVFPPPNPDWGALNDGQVVAQVQQIKMDAHDCTQTIDRMSIRAHGTPLYNDFPTILYASYLPLQYGAWHIQTPKSQCGPLLVTFNLHPGTYQPTGHINVSRAREFYLDYSSSVISPELPGVLVVVASALNFLLISDGSAVLRYST